MNLQALLGRARAFFSLVPPRSKALWRRYRALPRWQQIGTTSVGNPVFLDTRTVKRAPDGIVTATLRVPFVKPVKSPKGPLTGSRATAKFDCRSHKVAVLENTLYLDEKANRIYEHKVVKVPGYGAVIGGSLPAIGLRHFCGA